MTRPRNPSPFLIGICDEEKRVFNVVGPMTDDTQWIDRVSVAQSQGRRVSIQGTPSVPMTREEYIAEIARFTRYAYTNEPIILP